MPYLPTTHVRIDRKIQILKENFAILDDGHRRLNDFQVARLNPSCIAKDSVRL
jgi:hypothetical protein